MKSPFFYIITPCFNSISTMERTIRSVLSQTYDAYRYIIVDGGSKDGTVELIKRYAGQYPEKITYISEPDHGIYDAMNKGIHMAGNGPVGIVNSDDYYEADALEKIAEAWSEEEELAVYYGMVRILKNGEENQVVINHHRFLPERMICHPACFVNKKVYDTFGVYSAAYRSSSDYEYFLKLYRSEQVTFKPIYSILSNFSDGGVSGTDIAAFETAEIRKKYGYLSEKEYRIFRIKEFLKRKKYVKKSSGRKKQSGGKADGVTDPLDM